MRRSGSSVVSSVARNASWVCSRPTKPKSLKNERSPCAAWRRRRRLCCSTPEWSRKPSRLRRERAAVERRGRADGRTVRETAAAPFRRPTGRSRPCASGRSASLGDAREVDRPAVRGRADARRADAALDLDAVESAREVAEVHEVERLVLGLAQGHAVERDVEAGLRDRRAGRSTRSPAAMPVSEYWFTAGVRFSRNGISWPWFTRSSRPG